MDVETLTYRISVTGVEETTRKVRQGEEDISRSAKRGAEAVEAGTGKAAGGLRGMLGPIAGIAGPLAGVFAVDKAFEFGKELFHVGQQMDVFELKARTVFGKSNEDVTKWAEKNANAMGVSTTDLEGMAAAFGDLLKPMGFTSAQAADMSEKVTGLAGALSAWSGGRHDVAETSQILNKAMLGQTRGLKDLGINITENDIKQRLLADGHSKLTGKALEQAKALAVQSLIFAKSTDAQKAWGDGSFKNIKNSNMLKATFEELKESLASKFMPAANAVTGWLVHSLLPGAKTAGSAIKDLFSGNASGAAMNIAKLFGVKEGSAAANTIVSITKRITAGIQTVGMWFRQAAGYIGVAWHFVTGLFSKGADDMGKKGSWLGQTISKIGGLFSSVFGAIKAIIKADIAVITFIWTHFGDIIVRTFKSVWNAVKTEITGVLNFLTGIFDFIKDLLTGKWGKLWGDVKKIVSGAWQVVTGIIRVAWAEISGIFQAVGRVLSGLWSRLWGGIAGVFKSIWAGILGALRAAWDGITGALGAAWRTVTGLFSAGGQAVAGAWSATWGAIKGAFEAAWSWLAAIPGRVFGLLGTLWNFIADGLRTVWGWITGIWEAELNFLTSIPGRVLGILSGLWHFLSDALRTVWGWITGIWTTEINALRAIPGRVFGILSGVWHVIRDGLSEAWGWVRGVWDSEISFLTSIPGRIGRAVSGMWDGIKDAFRGAINWVIDHWNSFGFTFPSIDVPLIGKIGGWHFDTPNIPRLGEGGTVIGARPGGTLVRVAEAGRSELVTAGGTVVPLGKGWENRGLGGGTNIAAGAIVINYSDPDPARLVDLLRRYMAQSGPVPITVTASVA